MERELLEQLETVLLSHTGPFNMANYRPLSSQCGCALHLAHQNGIGDTRLTSFLYYANQFGLTPRQQLWIFDADWVNVDNTAAGAAKRVRYLLDNGDAPSNSMEQVHEASLYIFSELRC